MTQNDPWGNKPNDQQNSTNAQFIIVNYTLRNMKLKKFPFKKMALKMLSARNVGYFVQASMY